nr:MAG TPA: hypothetical protein [Caudoviricetes sp.]
MRDCNPTSTGILHVPPITILFSGSNIMRTRRVISLL